MSENETAKIRVAVVDDHEMFRAGVIATLRDSFDIVGQAADVPGSVEVAAVPRSSPNRGPTPPLPCFWHCRFRMRRRMWGR